MTLEEAKATRDRYLKIIGAKGVSNLDIIDVIVEPLTEGIIFRDRYVALLRQGGDVSNDIILRAFKSDNYKVSVLLSEDGLTRFVFDDIKEYKDLL